jgi:hypothetical protein
VEPLGGDEPIDYVRHQVKVNGGNADRAFDDSALSLLVGACSGVPRILNRAAALSLDLAVQGDADAVDVEAVLETLARLELAVPEEPLEPDTHTEDLDDAGKTPEPTAARTPKVKPTRKRSA